MTAQVYASLVSGLTGSQKPPQVFWKEQERWQILHLDLRVQTHFGWSDVSNLSYDAKFYC